MMKKLVIRSEREAGGNNRMERCLKKIAKSFNEHNIKWALGASMLLHYKGLVSLPNDIDIMVGIDDIVNADATLCQMGDKKPPNPNRNYRTKYFYEYVIDEIEVDVMAEFSIHCNGHDYLYRLEPANFQTIQIENVPINLCPIEDWYVLYLLMPNREDRAKTIETYLTDNKCNSTILQSWLSQQLPKSIEYRITMLIA